MRTILIVWIFLLRFTLVTNAPIRQPYEESEPPEDSLIDLSDEEIEDEFRRRHLGGLFEPEDAVTLLNTAIDQLTSSVRSNRTRRFAQQAQSLLELVTGQEGAVVDYCPMEDFDDDYNEATGGCSVHQPDISTIKKIIDMVDGTNGQKRRSLDSINKLYPWFHPRYVSRYRARISGRLIDLWKEIDRQTYKIFDDSRNKLLPIHGRMLQKWGRQIAVQIGAANFSASEGSNVVMILFREK